jgi:hypothetical protein
MRTSSQFASAATCIAAAALLAACSTRTVELHPTPVAAVPATTVVPATVVPVTPVAVVEFGRVTNIEYFPGGTAASRITIPGAVVGGVAGTGVVVASASSTTAMGAAAAVNPAYRVTIHTDAGIFRTYDVPATGDLRVGDRVRVESGVIYRS